MMHNNKDSVLIIIPLIVINLTRADVITISGFHCIDFLGGVKSVLLLPAAVHCFAPVLVLPSVSRKLGAAIYCR